MSTFANMKFPGLLARLFPDKSTKRASRFLDVTQRAVQRWTTEGETPRNIIAAMEEQVEKLEVTGFVGDLEQLISDASRSGIHPEVIGARLAQHYAALLGREID